jgi:eukaryotic-like serine/threonine-protein kinase
MPGLAFTRMGAHSELVGRTLGHYRIVGEIGAGGMGVVYRAHDEQLDRDVALKVLPPGTLADENSRKQFRKEALALAKVSHPNIATVFEFNSQDGTDFLAMELIPGLPLNAKLKQGPLPQPEIVRLAVQLADGLSAAHGQGVIHRDLKPANLFITPDGRLKILDFGLAKVVRSEAAPDLTLSITANTTGAIAGTVPYMSPEQLRGLPADVRSDVYAAGAVLYEMATGVRPFPQTQGPELMGAILHRAPPSARSVNPYVSAGLEGLVARSLEKEPSQRYQSARELRIALEALSAPSAAEAAVPRISAPAGISRRGVIAASLVLAFALIGGVAVGLNFRGLRDRIFRPVPANLAIGSAAPSVSVRPPRRSVAVLGFKNVSGQPGKAWLSTALAEMLTTELGAGETLRTVPGENVALMKANLSLPDADSYGRETLAKIHDNLNADEIVVGSFVPLGKNQIRLDLRLQDAVAGETRASVSEKGREDQIDDLVSRAGAELREKLGAGAVPPAEAAAVKAALPSNSEAARLYAEGLAKLHSRDALVARDLLQKSIALDPKFAQAHSALAAAWSALGYEGKEIDEAKLAFDLSGGLGREDKLAIEARYREATHDWNNAVNAYRTLSHFFPDNLEYGIRLASVQGAVGKPKDALETLRALKGLPPPASDDPRIDLEEVHADMLLSKWQDAAEASARAAAKARASGARLVLGQALDRQGEALRYLGQLDKADTLLKEAVSTFTAAGDRSGAAHSTVGLATTAYNRGDLGGARQLYQQSLAVFREIGSRRSVAGALYDVAVTYYDQGDLRAAEKMYEEALEAEREVGNKNGIANTLDSIGNVLADEGDQAGAKKKYVEALGVFRETGDQFETAMTMGNIGELLLDEGKLAQAKKMFEEALEIKRNLHNLHSQAYTLNALGSLYFYQGDLAGAKKSHEESLALRTQLGEKATAAEDSLALASITLEEGHADDALAAARQAGEVFRARKLLNNQALARELAARCLLHTGKTADAQAEIQQAQQLLANSDNHATRVAVAVTAGRVAAATGDFAAARRTLDAALTEATKANLAYFRLDARLALGQLEIKSGKTAAGRSRLAALEKEAATAGFLLIARKAESAANPAPISFRPLPPRPSSLLHTALDSSQFRLRPKSFAALASPQISLPPPPESGRAAPRPIRAAPDPA